MTRRNRRTRGAYMTTVTISLPTECILAVDRYAKQTGNNRSLALEYIIQDWKKFMQAQREAKQ